MSLGNITSGLQGITGGIRTVENTLGSVGTLASIGVGGFQTASKLVSGTIATGQTLYNEVSNFFSPSTPVTNSVQNAISATPVGSVLQTFGLGVSTLTATDITKAGISQKPNDGSMYFVKLKSRVSGGETFYCEVMPAVDEQGSVTYDGVSITHHPGTIEKYITTPSREWTLSNIKLISLTPDDATKNFNYINLLRSWRMPFYGSGTAGKSPELLGAPPPVLDFSGYFTGYSNNKVSTIPVVLTSLSITWANDVDYINTTDNIPFPVIHTISISIKEAWSPRQYSNFDLAAFRTGNMTAAYGGSGTPSPSGGGNNGSASGVTTKPSPASTAGSVAGLVKSGETSNIGKSAQAIASDSPSISNLFSNVSNGISQTTDNLVSSLNSIPSGLGTLASKIILNSTLGPGV
jgi:hypothetical protein